MVRVNGKEESVDGMLLLDYLRQKDYPVDGIAVECNEQIVDKNRYADYVLKEDDEVEIVSFVGGG